MRASAVPLWIFVPSSCQSKENFLCLPVQPLLSHTKQENVTLCSFPIFWLRRRGSVRDSKVNKTQINPVLWSVDAIDTARWRPAEDVSREKRGEEDEGDWNVRRLNGLHCAPAAPQSWAPKWGGHEIFGLKFSFLVFAEGFCLSFLCAARIMLMREVGTFSFVRCDD